MSISFWERKSNEDTAAFHLPVCVFIIICLSTVALKLPFFSRNLWIFEDSHKTSSSILAYNRVLLLLSNNHLRETFPSFTSEYKGWELITENH